MAEDPMALVDSHLHLQDPVFAPDFPEVLDRARRSGVKIMVCNATSEKDWDRVRELAEQVPEIVPCFGIHPWYLRNRKDGWEHRLRSLLEATPSALGEAGLDRWYEDRYETEQELVFREQLTVARDLRRPVMVHCLKAWGWLMRVLEDVGELPAGFLLHAYGGPAELIGPLSEKGAYFSFAGNVLDERKLRMRRSLQAVPADRLLLETDSPDLPPPDMYRVPARAGHEGRYRNEPANLTAILTAVAPLREQTPEQLAAMVLENACQLLGSVPGLDLTPLRSGGPPCSTTDLSASGS
ncbi:MAG: TatD family deoxyribonuclease [Acidobacteria bacterium]|nr:MAG: TatD family deoxyribonuclease [Acidobacteriota bacterium]